MKTLLYTIALAVAVGGVTRAAADSHEQPAWMAEMKNCAVCKSMAEHPDLMKNMTWETHKIDNGMINVAAVPKDQKNEFDALHAKMMATVAQVKADRQAGKDVKLCSFCAGLGELEKAGAKQQTIATATGSVCLVTSDDPALVQKIHAQADKAIAEQEKMKQNHHASQ